MVFSHAPDMPPSPGILPLKRSSSDEIADALSAVTSGSGYTTFRVPKKKQGEYRTIHAPIPQLKKVQKDILRSILYRKAHVSATGFMHGKSIVHNAQPHVRKNIVVSIDLKDFFDTIAQDQVQSVFSRFGYSKDHSKTLSQLTCHEGRLPQGAPTSPMLSNYVCFGLDTRITALLAGKGSYTRYADDITLSFDDAALASMYTHLVCVIIQDEGFTIQKAKRVRYQRSYMRQEVTGLIVNDQISLPRETRRLIRAMQHRQKKGALDPGSVSRLHGYLQLQEMVQKQRQQVEHTPNGEVKNKKRSHTRALSHIPISSGNRSYISSANRVKLSAVIITILVLTGSIFQPNLPEITQLDLLTHISGIAGSVLLVLALIFKGRHRIEEK